MEDQVAPDLLIADPAETLREGALVPTTKSGYIVYSQVTVEVLNRVCAAHGFSVDIPWQDLTPEQQNVVLYGSERIKIPFGKHPLESRMRWSGITARPREEGYYKGILPIIAEILKRNRNKNILRFVRSVPCAHCHGGRLRPEALCVTVGGQDIAALTALPLDELAAFLKRLTLLPRAAEIAAPILSELQKRIGLLGELGLGYLPLARESTTLSGGEAQRLRLATQVGTELHGILYVLDEPSIGLHHRDNRRLLRLLAHLRDNGNTVLVVEHDEETIRTADWLIDIGPGAGLHGGAALFAGPPAELLAPDKDLRASRTRAFLTGEEEIAIPSRRRAGRPEPLRVVGARHHNLKGIDVTFRLEAFNVVTGVSGAGKSSLVDGILARALKRRLHRAQGAVGEHTAIAGADSIDKVIEISQAPIGRTPRSNPATYTDLFDPIRELFANLLQARAAGFGKGHFSMNVKGGRCEACQGAGRQSIGMHFMGTLEIVCEACGGRRYRDEILAVTYRGKSIRAVLEMSVEEAAAFFDDQPKIRRILQALCDVGLGYVALGQPATTLSGGEAQRVKLAAELGRPATGQTLYILDEPTTGLHAADIEVLLRALGGLVARGNTVIGIEHNLDFIKVADWVVDLGPESGARGGHLVVAGTPEEVAAARESLTGAGLREVLPTFPDRPPAAEANLLATVDRPRDIALRGIRTHNLKGIDVTIPAGQLTVITGVSGSGKSSLAFDTIFAEGQRRFRESLATHARRYLGNAARAELAEATGLTPTIAISQQAASRNPRSTVATTTDIYDYLRLLYARAGEAPRPLSARDFSFNHHQGACPTCKGLGHLTTCDPEKFVSDPSRSLFDGALAGTKTGKFYGDPHGQHLAILSAVGEVHGIDFARPWFELDPPAREIAMQGTGARMYQATWLYKRDTREGEYRWETPWLGLAGYVNEEYERKHADQRGEAMRAIMQDITCSACQGARLGPEPLAVTLGGLNIAAFTRLSVVAARDFLSGLSVQLDARRITLTAEIRREILVRLEALMEVGLGYLALERSLATLSGGEAQRIRLATQLGAALCGVTYVLDEPTIGLHACDTTRLIGVLRRLCTAGNTVIVVEHDEELIRAADHLIDLGPGAGRLGGRIVAQGSVTEVAAQAASRTGAHLRRAGERTPAHRLTLRRPGIVIQGAAANNLLGCDLEIPRGGLIALTGVSGSGKSTLAFDVLAASWERGRAVGCREVAGLDAFVRLVRVDQTRIGGSHQSNPATYTGIFDAIRTSFAKTPRARERGYGSSRFSFNSKGGRCEACQGQGRTKVSMDFLADMWVTCEDCGGRRYTPETLECTLNGLSIAEVLDLTISEAIVFFGEQRAIATALHLLDEVGLGYLQVGQPTGTLSGGESQRLKLATELIGQSPPGQAEHLLLFDEPTTGLHFDDVARLLQVFGRLKAAGHTLLVIEHHPEVILAADWVIDLGPGGGPDGGRIMAMGTPEQIAHAGESPTAQVIRSQLGLC